MKSAYNIFYSEKFAEIKKVNPTFKKEEISSLVGEAWKVVKENPEQLKIYTDKKEEASSDSEVSELKEKKTRSKKGEAKNPRTARAIFITENRKDVKSANSELSATEITKKLGEMWKSLKTEDIESFKHYQNLAKMEKENFKVSMVEDEDVSGGGEEDIVNIIDQSDIDTQDESIGESMRKFYGSMTNEEVVVYIINKCQDESITMRKIMEELKLINVVIEKAEIKKIVKKHFSSEE